MRYGKAGIRKDSWNHTQDALLAETILRELANGTGVVDAAAIAAPIVGRSQASCYQRWNNDLQHLKWNIDHSAGTCATAVDIPADVQVTAEVDPVNAPNHYTAGGIETIDYLRAKLTAEEFAGFCRGNVLKYVSRAPLKNGVEDLRKARWYLDRLIGDGVNGT